MVAVLAKHQVDSVESLREEAVHAGPLLAAVIKADHVSSVLAVLLEKSQDATIGREAEAATLALWLVAAHLGPINVLDRLVSE